MNVPYASRSGLLDARGQPIQSGLSSPIALDFKKDGIVVFSGGTAANFLVDVFNKIVERRGCPLTYVIPISDNGGSSSELIRVLGGPSYPNANECQLPGVGDIRSRLVRLIPNQENEENTALRALFEHRLSADPGRAKLEWLDIVEGNHILWTFISSPKRELIRSVLNTLNLEVVKRSRPTSLFNFSKASVGNMARLFSGSFEAAIYLLAMICSIPTTVSVLPAINSNFTHHIAASLADGTVLTGQVAISHPSAPTAVPDSMAAAAAAAAATNSLSPAAATQHPQCLEPTGAAAMARLAAAAEALNTEDATLPGSLPVLRSHNISFSKDDEEDLPARIGRVWYINPYGHEIWPVANPKVLAALRGAEAVVYSIGSLYTSIIPSLILRGVGAAIAGGGAAAATKVLILNSSVDRETGPKENPMSAVDFVIALTKAASGGEGGEKDARRYVTHLVYLDGYEADYGEGSAQPHSATGELAPVVDEAALGAMGIVCVKVKGRLDTSRDAGGVRRYEEGELTAALERILEM
ncbi:hypothetical protein PpBr36_08157 [Pyricularia pennisetigena]|uniref:hypothetical protein n=1 Tax=Pyricularia pennisetigena TaxID=1578925 RepID=UPI0011501D2B|nr:hypothetical protein PpBr36_08157 [Pyricularia pennisetigena]TLS24458.1 hypothetical protein PpBr36_08157 [Pyricularia pennisetigena]